MIRLAAVTCVLVAGCSTSAGHSSPSPSSTAPAASPSVDPVQHYLDQVDALCDTLLTNVDKVMHGGHPGTYPVQTYYAEEPAHAKLRADFDRAVAAIPVPPQAAKQKAALDAYIHWANGIDAARAAAAKQGQAAFDKEIRHELTLFDDPVIQARDAAGFADSCTAR